MTPFEREQQQAKMTPREIAQQQAEEAMEQFILWSKRVCMWTGIGLLLVVVACNNGVETGSTATGSKYNGEQYDPVI
jgi:hypothetical protein